MIEGAEGWFTPKRVGIHQPSKGRVPLWLILQWHIYNKWKGFDLTSASHEGSDPLLTITHKIRFHFHAFASKKDVRKILNDWIQPAHKYRWFNFVVLSKKNINLVSKNVNSKIKSFQPKTNKNENRKM